MTTHIIVDHADNVLELTLNRSAQGNRVTMEMIAELQGRLTQLPEGVQLVVLKANGEDFSHGRDYDKAPEDARGDNVVDPARVRARMTDPILAMYAAVKNLDVPSVSVVQGDALGFGCALACACDIVVAGEKARFSLPELRERGLPPTLALTALLDRAMPRSLTYLAYSTETIDAHAARAAGLVSVVHRDDELAPRVCELVATIAAQPADSVKAVKRYLKLAPLMEPGGRAELGAQLFESVTTSRAKA